MRLLQIGAPGHERPAVLAADGTAFDTTDVAPEGYGPNFFASGGIGRLSKAVESEAMPRVTLDGHRLGAPIRRPGNLLCIGLNYAGGAPSPELPTPTEPLLVAKATNTVVGPNDPVWLPVGGDKTDWEVELAVVIGSRARYLPDEHSATQVIAGYCLSNDLSERSFQLEHGGEWVKGKSCETFNPLGPWLVTPDEIEDVNSLRLWLDVNRQRRQEGTTSDLIFSVPHIIWYLSQFLVLEPGDVINTGTPPGVGMSLDPPRYLVEGDVMELGIEGLGTQRQVCERAIP